MRAFCIFAGGARVTQSSALMPLKVKVEKLEDVEEGHRGLYTEDKEGGGGFKLAVEGLEDTGALKRAAEHERNEHKATKAALKKLEDERKAKEDEARKAKEDAARANGDVKALEESWTTKHTQALAAKDAEYKPLIESLTTDVNRLLIDNVAQNIANELAVEGCAIALVPHIKARLAVDVRDGERQTVVRDAAGKASALTLDELKKEIAANKAFAPLLASTKASGGGAGGGKGGGASGAKSLKRADFERLAPADKQKHMRSGGVITD